MAAHMRTRHLSTLQVVTYNIHKGHLGRHGVTVIALREALRKIGGDIVFLQEVQGVSHRHTARYADWPRMPQHEYLAADEWIDFAYGRNAVYPDGHHGNGILSRFPVVNWHNLDISQSGLEQRGLLHCEIRAPDWPTSLHCVNLHLGLLGGWRKRQMALLYTYLEQHVPFEAPLIVAGDFNDWSQRSSPRLRGRFDLMEAFEVMTGKPARSFPARLPLLRLDRIYVRGFRVEAVDIHPGPRGGGLSDHAALSATLTRILCT